MRVPQFTLDDYERVFADRHLLHEVVAKWAKAKPETLALLSAEGGRAVTWRDFDLTTTALARELRRLGFVKGDYLVTLLPLTVDHVLLEYSCFKIGVIAAPLDMRLSSAEMMRALEILRPRGFVSLGVKAPFDLRPLWRAVQAQCAWIQHCIVMDSEEAIAGTRSFASIADPALRAATEADTAALAGSPRTMARWSSSLPARPARPSRPCFRIATLPCRICASAAHFLAETAALAHWSICLRLMSAARRSY